MVAASPSSPNTTPGTKVEDHLLAMTYSLGLETHDAVLLIASVLGNTAGPKAGIQGYGNQLLSPRLNLLFTGDRIDLFGKVVEDIFSPVVAVQEHLRNQAKRQKRQVVDTSTFGCEINRKDEVEFGAKMRDHVVVLQQASVEVLLAPFWFTHRDPFAPGFEYLPVAEGRDSEALLYAKPWAWHRPSMLFRTSDVSKLNEMLEDCFDFHPLLVDVSGGFFQGSFTQGMRQGNRAIAELMKALGGFEYAAPRLHKQEGYGAFVHARVSIVTALKLSQLSEAIPSSDDAAAKFPDESICWNPEWREISPYGWEWWTHFVRLVEQVISERLECSGTVVKLSLDEQRALAQVENELRALVPSCYCQCAAGVTTLPAKLLWSLKLMETPGHEGWALETALSTARHLAQKHLEELERAEQVIRQRQIERLAQKILLAMKNKKIGSMRELQRSVYNVRIAEIQEAMDYLLSEGLVFYEAESRQYKLGISQNNSERLVSERPQLVDVP